MSETKKRTRSPTHAVSKEMASTRPTSRPRPLEIAIRFEVLKAVIGCRENYKDGLNADVLWLIAEMGEVFQPSSSILGSVPMWSHIIGEYRPSWFDLNGESLNVLYFDELTVKSVKFDGKSPAVTKTCPVIELPSWWAPGDIRTHAVTDHPSGGGLVCTEDANRRMFVLLIGIDKRLGLASHFGMNYDKVYQMAVVGDDRLAVVSWSCTAGKTRVEMWSLKTGRRIDVPIYTPSMFSDRIFSWNGRVVVYKRADANSVKWYDISDAQSRPFRVIDAHSADQSVCTSTGWVITVSMYSVEAFSLHSDKRSVDVLWNGELGMDQLRPCDLARPRLDESTRTLRFIATRCSDSDSDVYDSYLISITLPPEMCALPVCCDRDL